MTKSPLNIQVDTKGALKFLKRTNEEEKQAVTKAMKQVAFFMEGEVKESISGNRAEKKSIDTGRFRGSVKGTLKDPVTAQVESNLPYAKFLEYGTSKVSARRHFRNSVTRNKQKVLQYIQNEVSKVQ